MEGIKINLNITFSCVMTLLYPHINTKQLDDIYSKEGQIPSFSGLRIFVLGQASFAHSNNTFFLLINWIYVTFLNDL